MTIASIKILIDNQFRSMRPDFDDSKEPNDKYVLYCGTKVLEDEHFIRNYNAMNFPELTFHLYLKQYLDVKVKVMKYFNCCGIYCRPVIYELFARRLRFKMLDQEPLLKLKNVLLEELTFYRNKQGEPLTVDVMRIFKGGIALEDNLLLLKEINNDKDVSLVLLVPSTFKSRYNKEVKKEVVEESSESDEEEEEDSE